MSDHREGTDVEVESVFRDTCPNCRERFVYSCGRTYAIYGCASESTSKGFKQSSACGVIAELRAKLAVKEAELAVAEKDLMEGPTTEDFTRLQSDLSAAQAKVVELQLQTIPRTERCCECGVFVSDWVEADHRNGRICRPCESLKNLQVRLTAAQKAREEAETLELQRGNTLGRIAIALFDDKNNVTDEQCIMGVEALKLELQQYKKAHERFDAGIVELLQRCQTGEATCIFTAQVIEAEMGKLRRAREELLVRFNAVNSTNEGLFKKVFEKDARIAALETAVAKKDEALKNHLHAPVVGADLNCPYCSALAVGPDNCADRIAELERNMESMRKEHRSLSDIYNAATKAAGMQGDDLYHDLPSFVQKLQHDLAFSQARANSWHNLCRVRSNRIAELEQQRKQMKIEYSAMSEANQRNIKQLSEMRAEVAELTALKLVIADPKAVWTNMLRGTIAMPADEYGNNVQELQRINAMQEGRIKELEQKLSGSLHITTP